MDFSVLWNAMTRAQRNDLLKKAGFNINYGGRHFYALPSYLQNDLDFTYRYFNERAAA